MTGFANRDDWLYIRMYNVHSWSLIKCWNDKNINMVLYQQRIKSLARICFFFIPWEFSKCSSLLFLSIFLFRFTTFTFLPIYSFYANSSFFEKKSTFFALRRKIMLVYDLVCDWLKWLSDLYINVFFSMKLWKTVNKKVRNIIHTHNKYQIFFQKAKVFYKAKEM